MSQDSTVDYYVAHYALRGFALSNPMQFLSILASPNAKAFLDDVIQDVTQQTGIKNTLKSGDLSIHKGRVGELPCVIVEMPPPTRTADAFMVALVVFVDLSRQDYTEEEFKNIKGRFFTLEKGASVTGESRTVLGEWSDQAHINYGDGPAISPESFRTAIGELLKLQK